MAVENASRKATEFGFLPEARSLTEPITTRATANLIADFLLNQSTPRRKSCLILGCEPILKLADKNLRGLGGRIQQLVLESVEILKDRTDPARAESAPLRPPRFCMFAASTDGEDGPTNAAGAVFTDVDLKRFERSELRNHIITNNAYHLLEGLGLLVKTGLTGTNVCDLIVVTKDC